MACVVQADSKDLIGLRISNSAEGQFEPTFVIYDSGRHDPYPMDIFSSKEEKKLAIS